MSRFKLWVVLLLAVASTPAFAQGITFDPASGLLLIPSVRVGSDTYVNVAFRLSNPTNYSFALVDATRQIPAGPAIATYDAETKLLSLPTVQAGTSTYINVVLENTGNYLMVLKSGTRKMLPALSASLAPRLRGAEFHSRPEWSDADKTAARGSLLSILSDARMNVARIKIMPFRFEDGSPLLPGALLKDRLQASVETWTALLDWLRENKAYVIMSFNPYLGSQQWPDDGRSLWTDKSAQDELVEAWSSLTRRYAGQVGVIFDLMSEPHGTTPSELAGDHALPKAVWNDLYVRILGAIRSIDPDRWVTVEPIWGEAKYFPGLRFVDDPKLMFDFHFYAPHYFTHQGAAGWPTGGTVQYPGITQDNSFGAPKLWDKAALASQMQPAVDFAKAHSARMIVGELGCSRSAPDPDRAQWVSDAYELIERNGFDSVFFLYDGWGPPSTFRFGWGFENTPAEQIVLNEFRLN